MRVRRDGIFLNFDYEFKCKFCGCVYDCDEPNEATFYRDIIEERKVLTIETKCPQCGVINSIEVKQREKPFITFY